MTDRNINVHIGSLTDMGERFKAAWKDAEAGLPVTRDHVTFLSLESFMSAAKGRCRCANWRRAWRAITSRSTAKSPC